MCTADPLWNDLKSIILSCLFLLSYMCHYVLQVLTLTHPDSYCASGLNGWSAVKWNRHGSGPVILVSCGVLHLYILFINLLRISCCVQSLPLTFAQVRYVCMKTVNHSTITLYDLVFLSFFLSFVLSFLLFYLPSVPPFLSLMLPRNDDVRVGLCHTCIISRFKTVHIIYKSSPAVWCLRPLINII